MSRKAYEKNWRVYWLTACANIAAPTAAEIAAGKYMGSFVTKDGVAPNISQSGIDIASIDTDFDAKIGGSWAAEPELTLFRDNTTETNGWAAVVRGTNGFLVIVEFGTATAGNTAQVYPSEMGVGRPANSAKNEAQKFSFNVFVTSEPNLKAVIA